MINTNKDKYSIDFYTRKISLYNGDGYVHGYLRGDGYRHGYGYTNGDGCGFGYSYGEGL